MGDSSGQRKREGLKIWGSTWLSGSDRGLHQAMGRMRLQEHVPMKEEHPKRWSNTEFTALLPTHHTSILLKSLCQSENLGANLSQKYCSLPRSLPWTE